MAIAVGALDQGLGLLELPVVLGQEFGSGHEYRAGQAGLRCAMHWPDPAQRPRILEIRDNLIARIAEAEREGWLGSVEGLQISLAGAEDKLAQVDRRIGVVSLGLPATRNEKR